MTLGAHEIPVLIQLHPAQRVVVLDLLVGIEVNPALASRRPRPAVLCEREGLDAPVGRFDEVPLQRVGAERVLHLERGGEAVRAVGLNVELVVVAIAARLQSILGEF
jgi:hypothetical protein